MYNVTLLPGDGIGPEIAEATQALCRSHRREDQLGRAGVRHRGHRSQGKVPDSVLESIRKNKVALKAPITTPIGKGFRSVNVFLRQELNLYACVRPCKIYQGSAPASPATPSTSSWSVRTRKTSTPASSSRRATRRPST